MSKWVIENIELIKKTYVVEAYGKPAAILTAKAQAPTKVETISEVPFNVTAINEYEYDKDWANKTHQLDWVKEAPGRVKFQDPDIGPDQLKDGFPEDSFRDLEISAPLWPPYEREGNGK